MIAYFGIDSYLNLMYNIFCSFSWTQFKDSSLIDYPCNMKVSHHMYSCSIYFFAETETDKTASEDPDLVKFSEIDHVIITILVTYAGYGIKVHSSIG